MGLVALASVVAPSVAIAATLKADYQFQDTLASSVAAAPDLFDGGPGKAFDTEHVGSCPAARVLTFPADNGFSLNATGLVQNSRYSVVMLVRLNDVSGYRKLLDWVGGSQDRGLYVHNGVLDYFDSAGDDHDEFTMIAPGEWVEIAFIADQVGPGLFRQTTAINGVIRALSTFGAPNDATFGTELRFLWDDEATGDEETGGAVSRIRVYDGALTDTELAEIFGDSLHPPVCLPEQPIDATPPDARITKMPKDKTKKKAATFEFSSSEPGSTFQCSLDGGAFAACISPHTVNVKKGKHTFEVRAVDQAGNVGAPASDTWKRKKKQRAVT